LKRTFEEDLQRAVEFHGHLCGGQIIGTRISRYACKHFGIEDPDEYKDLIAFVEADRCLADAITVVAHCHLGRRRLKWYDYGKMCATFLDLATGEAIRLSTKNVRPADGKDQIAFYNSLPDDELIIVQQVEVNLQPSDLPGKPLQTVVCDSCGERAHDGRHVEKDGRSYCKPCSGEDTYYKLVQ
jgi:formylmethanofuran dehydrogenase subunit E